MIHTWSMVFTQLREQRHLPNGVQGKMQQMLAAHGTRALGVRAGCLLRQRDDSINPLLREDWRPFEGASRAGLMVALQQRLPPSLMLPERRLEVLVEQALHSQVRRCTESPVWKDLQGAPSRPDALRQQALQPCPGNAHPCGRPMLLSFRAEALAEQAPQGVRFWVAGMPCGVAQRQVQPG